ncbi:hypothetical protein VFPPC_04926 [Pochonia chlamydosporia 170]|uniref:Uncharacterized protein n=1 Tax=Pochonia chlamydosporia 170 TaxID=1380566 RepID=A0A179FSY1_METCM|nr:hypothetical protein VFPPC_04926 [Pochonia chlamydosporia 170]OAQ68725.1 hypothetical protein VFPPC_04926 [Pochonia chlamydosporia 170]
MALECKKTRDQVHTFGKTSIRSLSSGFSFKPYATAAKPEDEVQIPSPAIFDFAQNLTDEPVNPRRLPVAAACATHLELLEVFYVIRQKILMSKEIDASFVIQPNRTEKTGYNGDHKTLRDDTLWTRRQVKWPKYLEFAAVRFLHWLRILEENKDYMTVVVNGLRMLQYLPPLDILMIWHSFMLNPRLYMDHCQNHILYQIRMPWKLVHQAIDNRNWTLTIDKHASNAYERLTNMPANLFEQFETWHSQIIPANEDAIRTLSKFHLEGENQSTIDARLNAAIFSKSSSTRLDGKYFNLFNTTDTKLAVQLRDAVIRQAEFVDKMSARMWIRSPALEGTLRRGIQRYLNFLTLLKLYPKGTIVPTLDIDLVWHTHQCTGGAYAKGMKAITGRFVNHDDTIVKEKLDDGFDKSRGLYKIHFAQEYRTCGCWDCEALVSELEGVQDREASDVDMGAIAARVMEEVRFHRAYEVAIRLKKPLPIRS